METAILSVLAKRTKPTTAAPLYTAVEKRMGGTIDIRDFDAALRKLTAEGAIKQSAVGIITKA